MLSIYPACFFKEENGYSVVFPDLNWLATCGDSLPDAMNMAVDCLAGYLYTLKLDGDPIPSPSPMEEISASDVAKELDSAADYATGRTQLKAKQNMQRKLNSIQQNQQNQLNDALKD